jgi:hypothetical protein
MEKPVSEIPRFTNNAIESASITIEENFISRIAPLSRRLLETHRIPEIFRPLEKHYHIIPYVIYLPPDPLSIKRKVFPWTIDATILPDENEEELKPKEGEPEQPISNEAMLSRVRIIHLARKRTGNGGYPGEFLWPLDAWDLTAHLIWAPKWLATELVISDKEGRKYPIVATKYPIRDKEKWFRDVISSPFQPGTDAPENLTYGKFYSSFLMSHIHSLLRSNPPAWLPLERLELFGQILQGLSLIENMDPSEYPKMKDEDRRSLMHDQVDRVFTILWLNGPESFRRDSSAWARGFLQIIEPTWNQLRRDYPHPTTDREFREGAIDHVAAGIMAYAHLTQEYKEYMKYPRIKAFFENGWEKYFPYLLAAGYNSNVSGRAAELDRILSFKWGGKILPKTPEEVFQVFFLNMRHANPKETEWYMKKLEFVANTQLWMKLPPTPIR